MRIGDRGLKIAEPGSNRQLAVGRTADHRKHRAEGSNKKQSAKRRAQSVNSMQLAVSSQQETRRG